jgi:hypothetical protein
MRFCILAVVALGIAAVAAQSAFAAGTCGAQWYPFYGYHRPSYLSERPAVVATAPAPAPARPVLTGYNAAAQEPTTAAQPAPTRQCRSARWYPFYGYNRPSYLDQ